MSLQDKINFARHLHLTIKSGISLVDGLQLVKEQNSSRAMRAIVADLIQGINRGRLLAESLEKHRKVFGDFFIGVVRMGERSGNLSQNLLYLSDELMKRKDLNGKIKAALVYPIIILVATIGITLFLIFFVLPRILPILMDLGTELPATTKALVWVVEFASAYGLYALGGLIILAVGFKTLLKADQIRFWFDYAVFFLPVISRMTTSITMTQFTRTLNLLLKSGLAIVDALEVSKGTVGNLVYKREVERAMEHVKKGEQIASYLSVHKRFFPIMVSNLIKIGESTGHLEENLLYLSEYYEREVDEGVKGLTALLEPFLLLFMGLMVGFVAISIILPIYQIAAPQF